MNLKAVVYTSNTGETEKYAKAFAAKENLPCMELKEAEECLEKHASLIYFGWIFADTIQGYDKTATLFDIPCVCGVGMSAPSSKDEAVAKASNITDGVKLFTFQGGLHMNQLSFMHKMILSVVRKSTVKKLQEKQRTPQEESDLALWKDGGSRFDPSALDELSSWCHQNGLL